MTTSVVIAWSWFCKEEKQLSETPESSDIVLVNFEPRSTIPGGSSPGAVLLAWNLVHKIVNFRALFGVLKNDDGGYFRTERFQWELVCRSQYGQYNYAVCGQQSPSEKVCNCHNSSDWRLYNVCSLSHGQHWYNLRGWSQSWFINENDKQDPSSIGVWVCVKAPKQLFSARWRTWVSLAAIWREQGMSSQLRSNWHCIIQSIS